VIHAHNLSFTYPGSRSEAISDLTFDLPKGAFGLIEAAGGSGKSTLIKLLLGIYKPSAGDLEVNGRRVSSSKQTSELRRSIGVVSDGVDLIEDRTVAENVTLPLELAGLSTQETKVRLLDTLHRFGLEEIKNEFPASVSEGERRRTKLARALVSEPFLLVLDDPTLGLDPVTSDALWDLLFREHQRGMTILAAVTRVGTDRRFAQCLRIPLIQG
jgi:cell division transport system ATP-binding protein